MQKAESDASSSAIKKLIFFYPRPVSAFEEDKWCFSYLRSQGFEIEVLDLTELLHRGREFNKLVAQPLQGDFIHHINSYQELECFVKRFSGDSLFIDYLVGCSKVTLREERVFRLLKKYGVNYTFLTSGALPLPSRSVINKSGKIKIFQSRVVKILTNPYKLLNFLVSEIIVFLTRHRIVYPLPVVIFGGDSEVLRLYVEARNFDKGNIVPVHSFDYDSSMLFLRGLGNKLPENDDICVFLDEAATHHSDFAILGIEPAAAEFYFVAMNRFFDFVEKNTGLKVVIAAHPRSEYESMSDVFGGRAVIKDKTLELVARSKLVVVHMSTSLSYAVLFKKPVISVKIPGMRVDGGQNLMVETMGEAIGSKPIDLDKDELTSSLLQCEYNLEKYSEYKKRYVKTVGADELPAWEIVAKTVKNIQSEIKGSSV